MRTVDDARRLLRAGADKVAVNTAAVERPELVREIADEFGGQCVVVAIDARAPGRRSRLGGLHPRRPHARPGSTPWPGPCECAAIGAGEILLTSMDRDGTRDGFDLELTRAVVDAVDIPVVASGGVGPLAAPGRRRGRRVAPTPCWRRRSSTSREFTIGEAKAYMAAHGVIVRPA